MSVQKKVIDVVATTLKINGNDLTLSSGLGCTPKWDSLNHTNLVLDLENFFDVDFDFEELDKIVTIEKIVDSLISKGITD